MAKKLILLLLIIPIVVMILLFAATQSLSNLVEVPVTGIDIIGTDEFVYLDMDKEETYTIEYAVYPTTAKNKNVSVSTEAFGSEPLASFDFEIEDGKVTVVPTSAGAARVVLTTVSGGFRDSIVIYADSTKLQAIESTITKSELLVGETAKIDTKFLPENPSNTLLEYVSSNPAVVQVTPNGVVRALSRGEATITITSEFDRSISDTVTVTVSNKDEMDLGAESLNSFYGKGSIPISIKSDNAIALENLSYQILDEEGNPVPETVISAQFKIDGTSVTLEYEFIDADFVGSLSFEITFTHDDIVITKTCEVSKMREIEVSFEVDGVFNIVAGTTAPVPHILTPEDAEVTYTVTASNNNLIVSVNNNGRVIIEALKAGVTEVTLTATNVAYPDQVKTATVTVVITPKKMTVTEAAKEYGIEKTLTIGALEFDATGKLVPSALGNKAFVLHFQTPTEKGEGFYENVYWHSSSDEVLIDNNGVISFVNGTFEGLVSFWPTFYEKEVDEGKVPEGAYTIRCVANGINVYSYAELYYATKKVENSIVLHNDIRDDFGYINGEVMYTEMDTTYDYTYYENANQKDAAKVKILLQFRNDLYGNGHVINAHNVTYKLTKESDDKGNIIRTQDPNALFQGPLDFVKITQDNGATISVKAQDNICFALYEGVTVNNVELRGCDLESDSDGNQDLVDLDYIGTTVEVLGDDVTIEYSRLTNGRTVLRVFGDENYSTKKINLFITNSVLSGAREFIMRIGSNRFENANGGDISPNLPGDVKGEYDSKKEYHNFTEAQKKAYDEKYINTFVTVKNSVFKDTAIFAIGMDSHFAGGLLHDGPGVAQAFGETAMGYVKDWRNLAKTSYGAKLKFEGDVELYNWKDLNDVDSSTLIELKGSVGGTFAGMKLDLKAMVEKAVEKKPELFGNILTDYNGKKYVHAGIAFFGGGKNYSIFDSDQAISLGRYEVSLEDVEMGILEMAAGNEDFYFFIYDKTSPNSSPAMQEKKLADKSAYECIYKK